MDVENKPITNDPWDDPPSTLLTSTSSGLNCRLPALKAPATELDQFGDHAAGAYRCLVMGVFQNRWFSSWEIIGKP